MHESLGKEDGCYKVDVTEEGRRRGMYASHVKTTQREPMGGLTCTV